MSRGGEIDAWFESYDYPMKGVVQRIRAIILAADSPIEECEGRDGESVDKKQRV